MNADVEKILASIEDQCNLPFASAQGFAYVNQRFFHPRYKPSYKLYFAPFKEYRHNTIYQLANVRPLLAKHMTDRMLKDALNLTPEDTCIAFSHIFVAGITEKEADDVAAMNNEVIQPLLQRYKVSMLDSEDFQEVAQVEGQIRLALSAAEARTKELQFGLKDCEFFDIPLLYPRNNILVFTLNVI